MQRMEVFAINDFSSFIENKITERAISALESGRVILLPDLEFQLQSHEQAFLTPHSASGKSKNISYCSKSNHLRGDAYQNEQHEALKGLMQRFAHQANELVNQLFPRYKTFVERGRTSYRPVQAQNRENLSPRKDDQRLHVDAFPATPTQGKRILRVFSNINPHQESRVWRLGDQFENVVEYFLPRLKRPRPLKKYVLRTLRVTKELRTDYDAFMLQLHNKMKMDEYYQANALQAKVHLPASSTWIVFTDQASHAAMSGQYCLEQTFYLPVEALAYPERSPLHVLQKKLGRVLTV